MKTYKKIITLTITIKIYTLLYHHIRVHRHLPSTLKGKQIRVVIEALVIIVCRVMSQLCLSPYSSSLLASPYLHNEGSRKNCDIAGTM